MVLALSEVSVAHGTTAAVARLDLFTFHEIERTLVSLVDSLHARGHSKLLFRLAIYLSAGRHSLVLIGLLAREARILNLVRATERSRSVVRAASLELRLLIVLVHAEINLRLVLQASRLVEPLIDMNGRSEHGARSHHI